MIELQIMVITLLILFAVSAAPIIELKYYSDLYDYADTMNKHCYNNDETRLKSLQEKDKYMWKISNYLYDFSKITEDDNIKRNTDYMVVYQSFWRYSLGIFIFLILFAMLYILLSYNQSHIYKDYYNIIIFIYIVMMVIAYIIVFSSILKKITEIYNDNEIVHNYLYFMKQIDDHLQNTKSDIAYDKTSTENIYNVKHVIFDDTQLDKLYNEMTITNKGFIYEKKNNDKVAIENKEDFKYIYKSFTDEKKIKEIKNKINVVTSYLIAYMIFTAPLLLILFRTINNSYIYIYTIVLIVIAVIIYYIYNLLR